MKKRQILIQLLIVAAILVVANLVSGSLYFRLDFTEDRRYTLSNATENVLEDLGEVVTVTAYVSEDLPPQINAVRNELEDMLIEYENMSGGNVVYQFENPQEDEIKEQEIQQKGIAPLQYTKRENDRAEQARFYLGATLQLGERTEVIPYIQSEAMEYYLTTSIKKLAIADKPKVALIQGHGEQGLANLPQLQQELSVLYDVEDYTLSTEDIPTYFRAVALVAPKDTIPASDFLKLENYLAAGGALFIAHTNVTADLQQARLLPAPQIGLVSWLQQQGVTIGTDFVTDAQCGTITYTQQTPIGMMRSQKQFPFFPAINSFEDHPVVKGIDQVTLSFATSVTANSMDSSVRVTDLMYTSDNSGVEPAPTFIDINRRWTKADFGMDRQSLAVAVEGLGNGFGKMVVVGNGDFFSNGAGQQMQQVQPDHVNFAANAIDWLADDTGLIDLRTKGVTARPLVELEDGKRNFYKYGNVFAPILLLLVYGFVRRVRNQRKVAKWREGIFD